MKRKVITRLALLVCASVLALTGGGAAFADDSEIFTGPSSAGIAPNVLFILDTSGSMDTSVSTQTPYDPNKTYSGSCSANSIYFQNSGAGTPTGCSGLGSFAASYQKCLQANTALALGTKGGPGYYQDHFVQWQVTNSNYAWNPTLTSDGLDIACLGDFTAAAANSQYPTTYNGPSATPANEWTSSTTAANSYWNANGLGGSFTIYNGNYLNYRASNPATTTSTRIKVVQQAASNFINSISGMNIGLMRYSNNDGGSKDSSAAGGMVAYPVSPIWSGTVRSDLVTTLKNYSAGGWTPLSETLYEAYLYYSGGKVNFGNNSVPFTSVAASRDPADSTRYSSPIQSQCQKNFIIYLTDGLPTQDNQADTAITSLLNNSTVGGACDDTTKSPYNGLDSSGKAIPGGWGPAQTAGKCMAALATYLNKADLSSKYDGTQNVQLYTIGFGGDAALTAASSWLVTAATNGGGKFYSASDLDGLQSALSQITNNVLGNSTSFAAPTVPIDPANRTETLNNVYMSMFQPSANFHWPGNVKKYKLLNGTIVAQNDTPAIDPNTGFIADGITSFWSTTADGSDVTKGGAASQIPDWSPTSTSPRTVYTYIGSNSPTSALDLSSSTSYAFTTTNANITTKLLAVSTTAQHDAVINYARGENLKQENQDSVTTDTRHAMGDPSHSQPAVLIYDKTTLTTTSTTTPPTVNGVVFSATNDGFLHEFDINTGKELWSFIPQEMLSRLNDLYQNNATMPRRYGLDGNIVLFTYDVNGDGIIKSSDNDRVFLYVGTGRGGNVYYALDVTDKTKPKFMWALDRSKTGLSGLGQTWSTPRIARVNINGATQNTQKLVLIFGGGYDTAEESPAYQTADSTGNGLYIVDAFYGSVLWSAGRTGSTTAQLQLDQMDHAIPSDVAVLDLDGDGLADRMYVGDMGGQLWRFDIYNGNSADKLVTGGRIATLGTHDDQTHDDTAARRFYYPPDVVSINQAGTPAHFALAIGSGYRGHPLNTAIQDRFYVIRDYNPYVKLSAADYKNFAAITEASLVDATKVLAANMGMQSTGTYPNGWMVALGGRGEKVLAPATTLNYQVMFTSYTPNVSASASSCVPAQGTNTVYAMSVLDASPTANLNNQGNQDVSDRSRKLKQGGIVPGVTVVLSNVDPSSKTKDGKPVPPNPPSCIPFVDGLCKPFGTRVKTYWSEQDAN